MLTHAGDVSAEEAFAAVAGDPAAVLVDCRSRAEWDLVGVPVAERVVFVEWVSYPEGVPNARFLDELRSRGVGTDDRVYFLCRSGHRSAAAALTAAAAGFATAYNVVDGFEGPVSPDGRRDQRGWRAAGLPWQHG